MRRASLRRALAALTAAALSTNATRHSRAQAPMAREPEAPPTPTEPEVLEVEVTAEKPAPATKTMTREEVRQLPGAFGDPFRAIEAMPGVTPIVSGLPFFYVRGAPPGNVGYYLDGVRVPYLFHAAAGPSVLHPSIVERVDLYSGGYPARYGRFAGAIVAAETTAPSPDFRAEASLRIVDAGALVEAPFAENRGAALVAGRYSYTAAVVSLLSPDLRLDYRDFQARFSYALGARERVSIFAFGSYDLLATTKNDIETIVFGSEFYRLDARYDLALPSEGKFRWAATVGFDQTRIADQRNARDAVAGTRVEVTLPLSSDAKLRGGIDFTFDDYEADPAPYGDLEDPDVGAYNRLFPSRVDAVAAVWSDTVVRLGKRFEVTPGLRVDVFHSNGASAVGVDPRLAVRADVTKKLRLLHALGVAHQPPSFIVPVPGLAISQLRDGLQRSVQASAGVEADLPWRVTSAVTVFGNVFLDMTDSAGVGRAGGDFDEASRSFGASRGLEVYVKRNLTSQLGGFAAYTLSRSTRKLGPFEFPFAFDRTHVLNLALAYGLGRGWRLGGRFTFYTGVPDLSDATPPFDPAHPPRQPSFYRVDWRLEKRWRFGGTRSLSFVAEVLNTTLNKEIIGEEPIGPITIPSLGLEGTW